MTDLTHTVDSWPNDGPGAVDKWTPGGVVGYVDDGSWHIGQGYEKKTVDTVFCKRCGGKEFNVGQGCHYTAIRCVKCQYEVMAHEG